MNDTRSNTTRWQKPQAVIDDADVRGAVHRVGPGEKNHIDPSPHDRLCFVSSGSVTVTVDEINTILLEDELVRIRKDKPAMLRNHGENAAKLLILELPPPPVQYLPARWVEDEPAVGRST